MAPIFFRIQDGKKVIVAGERRCAAAKNAGRTHATARKIAALDIKTLTKEERKNFVISLQNMKEVVENAMATAAE